MGAIADMQHARRGATGLGGRQANHGRPTACGQGLQRDLQGKHTALPLSEAAAGKGRRRTAAPAAAAMQMRTRLSMRRPCPGTHQVRTVHQVPNFLRPWEEGHAGESASTAFAVALPDPGLGPGQGHGGPARLRRQPGAAAVRRQQRPLVLVTTAGAVEHAKRVEVLGAGTGGEEFEARVLAVCLDMDVALLQVDDPAFWRQEGGVLPLELEQGLPQLRQALAMAGYSLGGASLGFTSGVVSRLEVVEYSHSSRALLALQVDAPLNNGCWGGPALSRSNRVVGMAFQKFAGQTWMERYDEEGVSGLYGGDAGQDGDDGEGPQGSVWGDGEEEGGAGYGDGDGGEAPGGEHQGEDNGENIGYLVPSQLLQLVLQDYCQATATGSDAARPLQLAGPAAAHTPARRRFQTGSTPGPASAGAARVGGGVGGPAAAPLYLDGRPRLGLRYQRLESPVLRRALGLAPAAPSASPQADGGSGSSGSGAFAAPPVRAPVSGVLVTAVDPSGSAAGVVRVHDILTAVGGRPVSPDGTTLLRPGARVLFGHWAAVGEAGGSLELSVLRKGQPLELEVTLRGSGDAFIPTAFGPSRRPSYLVVGPLVWVALSLPYYYQQAAASRQAVGQAAPGSPARRAVGAAFATIAAALEWGMPAHLEASAEDDLEVEEVVLLAEVLECGSSSSSRDGSSSSSGQRRPGPAPARVGSEQPAADSHQPHPHSAAPRSSTSHRRSSTSSGSSRRAEGEGAGSYQYSVEEEAQAWRAQLGGEPRRLAAVNGQRVTSLAQLARLVVQRAQAQQSVDDGDEQGEADGTPFLRFDLCPATEPPAPSSSTGGDALPDASGIGGSSRAYGGVWVQGAGALGTCMVVDARHVTEATRKVLAHHAVSHAMSADLRRQLDTTWPFEKQQASVKQRRRQQGRRGLAAGGRR